MFADLSYAGVLSTSNHDFVYLALYRGTFYTTRISGQFRLYKNVGLQFLVRMHCSFSATPLPSNMLAYGLMRARSVGLYVGFWAGRAISYYVMISISQIVLLPFLDLFEDRLIGILVADIVGIAVVVLFASVKWGVLVRERRLRFARPHIWKF